MSVTLFIVICFIYLLHLVYNKFVRKILVASAEENRTTRDKIIRASEVHFDLRSNFKHSVKDGSACTYKAQNVQDIQTHIHTRAEDSCELNPRSVGKKKKWTCTYNV